VALVIILGVVYWFACARRKHDDIPDPKRNASNWMVAVPMALDDAQASSEPHDYAAESSETVQPTYEEIPELYDEPVDAIPPPVAAAAAAAAAAAPAIGDGSEPQDNPFYSAVDASHTMGAMGGQVEMVDGQPDVYEVPRLEQGQLEMYEVPGAEQSETHATPDGGQAGQHDGFYDDYGECMDFKGRGST
jgi:hypothetical protein